MGSLPLPSWSRCFVCTSNVKLLNNEDIRVDEEADDSHCKLIKPNWTCFFKYLLGTSAKTPALHKLLQSPASISVDFKSQVKLCKDCDKRAKTIWALHLELEVVQMKILNVIKCVKSACRLVGENYGFQDQVDNFEKQWKQLLDNDISRASDIEEQRGFLKAITEVHGLLSRNETNPKVMFPPYSHPNVVLDRCLVPTVRSTTRDVSPCTIKNEPEDSECEFYPDDDNDLDLNDDEFMIPKRNDKTARIRKRKRRATYAFPKKTAKRSKLSKERSRRNPTSAAVNLPIVDSINGDKTSKTEPQDDSEEPSQPSLLVNTDKNQSPLKAKQKRNRNKCAKSESTFINPFSESIRSETEQELLNIKADVSSDEIFRSLKRAEFACLSCEFKTDVGSKMDQHLRDHETEEKTFHCPDLTCKRSFSGKQHFVFHLQQHCTRIRRCLTCDESLPVLQMEEHLKIHYDRLFSCEWCDWSFGNFPDLIHHCRYHPRVQLKCQLCTSPTLSKKRYQRRSDLRKHLHDYHNMEELLLLCDYPGCEETFLDPFIKLAHANIHKKENICQICSKGFTCPANLSKHLSTAHETNKQPQRIGKPIKRRRRGRALKTSFKRVITEAEKLLLKLEAEESSKQLFKCLKHEEFVCTICGHNAQKSWQIHQHFQEHETDEKSYHCPEKLCMRAFTNKQTFVFHLQNHCVRKRKCDTCKVVLPVLDMREHLKTHHERVFHCELCDFSFGDFKDLLFHGAHHAKADIKCQLCTEPETNFKLYSTRQLLLEHLYVHHRMEDLLLKCDDPECTETFLDRDKKRKHIQNVHNKKAVVIKRRQLKKDSGSKPKLNARKKKPNEKKSIVDNMQTSEVYRLLSRMEADASSYEIFKSLRTDSYSCVICQFRTTRNYLMDQHLREHEGNNTDSEKSFHCPQPECNKSFALKQSVIFHLQQHCTRKRKCDCCEKSLPVLQMGDHLRTHYDQLYYCQLCDYCFGSLKDLISHGRYHKKTSVKCQLCEDEPELATKIYPSFTKLFEHLYEYHKKDEALLKCSYPDCNETFFDTKMKREHDQKHKGVHKCKFCPKSFKSAGNLAIHLVVHKTDKNFLCDQCPEGFRIKSLLDSHMVSAHGIKVYVCELCPEIKKSFCTKPGLETHIRIFHEKRRWKCSVCDQELRTKARLIYHEQTHLADKSFQCPTCGFATQTMEALKRHEKLHGEKTYVCSYCPKAFTIKRYLNEHNLTHTRDQPFVCDLCGCRFNQRTSLYFHMRKKHGYTTSSDTKAPNIAVRKEEAHFEEHE